MLLFLVVMIHDSWSMVHVESYEFELSVFFRETIDSSEPLQSDRNYIWAIPTYIVRIRSKPFWTIYTAEPELDPI